MRGRFASLTSRLVLTAVTLVAAVSLLVGVTTTLVMHETLTGRLDESLLEALNRAQKAPAVFELPDHRKPDVERGRPPQDLGTVTVYFYDDREQPVGSVLTPDPQSGLMVEPLDADVLRQIQAIPLDERPHNVRLRGLGSYRLIGTDVGPGPDTVVGLPTEDVDDAVGTLIWTELLLGLLAVLAAGGASTIVVRRQLRPLREVAATAHAVAELPLASGEIDLSERVPGHLTDARTEVGQVGAALNTLLAHVESSLEARQRSEQQVRQFVADASHELRTPLATIAGYTQLARRRPDDTEASATALAKVDDESSRMTGLVEDLLLLARLDAGRPLAHEPVDLTRLLLEAVSDARVLAPDHRWRLELPDEALEVTGDGQRLHQVVTNLLTNVRKHTPSGTTVTVAADATGFTVRDDGPGFPDDLAGRAFERFARGDDSRVRGPDGGSGLGLALVEAIVTAHGGTASLTSQPGETTVRVKLPQ